MKLTTLFVLIGLLFTNSKTDLPSKIPDWMINAHSQLEVFNINHPVPSTFFDNNVKKILKDSFLINNPNMLLKIHSMSLEKEQDGYGFKNMWIGIGTAYGMLPGNGNYWEDIAPGMFPKLTMKYVGEPLIKNRESQTKLYEWAKPTIISSFSSKSDIAQALDMFAIWKTNIYLANYVMENEIIRTKQTRIDSLNHNQIEYNIFTSTDWLGRDDTDAKMYAFWHRRIISHHQSGSGFSVHDARFWSNTAYDQMYKNSSIKAKAICLDWIMKWGPNFTGPDECNIDSSLCEE